ncbi:MAG: glycosyltransferase [Fimbriimonadaceae bacterium]|nr:glycosyltransferase [Fimbriimonadaceae bacterium]
MHAFRQALTLRCGQATAGGPRPHGTRLHRSIPSPVRVTPGLPLTLAAALPPREWERAATAPEPEVSVVVRCCGEPAGWVRGAVESVLGQAGVRVEVVVVDDGGEPAVEPWAEPRVGWVRLPYNAGTATARQAGLRRARGEFVRVLDADDELPPGALAAQVAWLRAHPAAQAVAGRLELLDEPGVPWAQHEMFAYRWDGCQQSVARTVLEYPQALIPLPTVLWRRTWQPPAVPVDFVAADDLAFLRGALERDRPTNPAVLGWLEQPVWRYRRRAGSNSGQGADALSAWRRGETERRVVMAERLGQRARLLASGPRPRRVAYLDWHLIAGGAQWALVQIAAQLDRRLVEPLFLVALESPLSRWVAAQGVEVLVKPPDRDYEPWVCELLRQREVDVVDCVWAAQLITPAVARCVRGVFAHAQSVLLHHAQLRPEDGQHGKFQRFIAVSQAVVDRHPHLAARAVVIPSPVDGEALRRVAWMRPLVRQALGIGADETVVLWAGRLIATEKRADLLRRIVEQHAGVRFLIAGHLWHGARDRAQVAADWAAWAAGQGAVWVDQVEPYEMPLLYAAADIYLSTSEVEGQSLALLEALAAGLYPVVTDAGGTAEAVDDPLTGRVVPLVGGQVDLPALSAALGAVVALPPSERAAVARRARHAAVVRFDVREAARYHELVYHGWA